MTTFESVFRDIASSQMRDLKLRADLKAMHEQIAACGFDVEFANYRCAAAKCDEIAKKLKEIAGNLRNL